MACAHPFGSTAGDLKVALALSRESKAHEANVVAQLADAIALSKEEEQFQLIFDSFLSVFQQHAITAYVDGHCRSFEDSPENKLEYTQIHIGYKHLVDELLTGELSDLEVTSVQFEHFCERCLNGREMHCSFKTQLLSTDDFMAFKRMMIDRKSALSKAMPSSRVTICENAAPKERPQERRQTEDVCADKAVLQQPSSALDMEQSLGFPQREPAARPTTLLERPSPLRASPQAMKVKPGMSSPGVETVMPQSCKKFYLYQKRNCIDGDTDMTQPTSLGIKPELWLSKQLPSEAPSWGLSEEAPERHAGPTHEECQQRAEYWCKRRDLLRERSTANDTKITAHTSYVNADQLHGARLAEELSCPADDRPGVASVDAAAMRQALTRQLRGTFENART